MDESTAQDELAFIKKVMTDSRRIIIDDGKIYLIWGILVIIGVLLEHLMYAYTSLDGSLGIWITVISLCWFGTIWVIWKRRTWPREYTFAGKILSSLWVACFVAMTILGFIGFASGGVRASHIGAVLATVIGIGFFVNGTISDYRWFHYISFGWWGGSIFIFFTHWKYRQPTLALLMLFFMVIPGIWLNFRWRKQAKTIDR